MDELLEDRLQKSAIFVASIKKRALAYVIDDLLVSLIVVAVIWGKIESAQDAESIINVVNQAFLQIIVLRILYQAFFVWFYGATLGKIFLRIKVIDTLYLDKPNMLAAVVRATVRTINEVLFYFGFIFAFFDPNKLTLHDRASKTLVVDAY